MVNDSIITAMSKPLEELKDQPNNILPWLEKKSIYVFAKSQNNFMTHSQSIYFYFSFLLKVRSFNIQEKTPIYLGILIIFSPDYF